MSSTTEDESALAAEIEEEIAEASKTIASQKYPILNELLETMILHAVGQLLVKYRFKIRSGDSTVKLALTDHRNAGVILAPSAISYLYELAYPNAPSEDRQRAGAVFELLQPVLEGCGLQLLLTSLGLEVIDRPLETSGRYYISIRSATN